MDVVVRTPHGDADIEIVAAPADTTLADLLRAVTGQAPPATSRVDGRTVATSRPLDDLDVVIGSLIDTRPAEDPVDHNGRPVGLIQLTGRGAGIERVLGPGRYRVGSSRRLHASELESAPVETPAFELAVGDDGVVDVTPGPDIGGALGVYTPTLHDQFLDRELPWTQGRLHVGGRLFELERPAVTVERRTLPAPGDDGTISFERPPTGPATNRPLVVGAIRAAREAGGHLWQTRPSDPGAFVIPYGIHADGVTTATVDLQRHRGVAAVGSDRFTTALARTLLVELCTLHGPADLNVAVASSPERIAQWNWSKWLPHIREGVPTAAPRLFADADSLTAWAAALSDPSTTSAPRTHPDATPNPADWKPPSPISSRSRVTVLVLDDISLWSQRDSPIRSLLVDPPPELRIMALCVGMHEAPGMCTSLIEEVPPADRLAHLSSITTEPELGRPALFGSLATEHLRLASAPEVVTDIRPALVDLPQAAEVARHLAPLDDLEAERRLIAPTKAAPPTLGDLVDDSADRADGGPGLLVTIGVQSAPEPVPSKRSGVAVDLASSSTTIIAASDNEHHDQTMAALILGAAAQRRPDELAILVVGRERPAWHREVPHISGWAGRDEADDAPRLIHRVAHVLTEQPELHVVVVIEHAFDQVDPLSRELVSGMTELAVALPNVHVVLSADHPDSVPESTRAACAAFAWIAPSGDGTAWFADRSVPFVGVARHSGDVNPSGPTSFDAPHLIVRATSHGRAMTPLERRLSRVGSDDAATGADDLATMAVARQITSRVDAAGDTTTSRPSLLPPPLPLQVEASLLLERHDGDGVPIGLVDRPEHAENEAYWWQPGSNGSILAAGSPRSGMTSIVDLIITGAAARIAADDLHVYAIEALPQRRRALEALPHTGTVVSPEDPADVARLVTGLREIMTERVEDRDRDDRPDIVLLIADLGRMRRSLDAESLDPTLDQLGELAASGSAVGINVVIVTTRVDDLGPLARLNGDRLVGALTDPDDRLRLGAPPIGPADRHLRRCWSTMADRRVQLATPANAVDEEITRLAPEPARHRTPVAIVRGAST